MIHWLPPLFFLVCDVRLAAPPPRALHSRSETLVTSTGTSLLSPVLAVGDVVADPDTSVVRPATLGPLTVYVFDTLSDLMPTNGDI